MPDRLVVGALNEAAMQASHVDWRTMVWSHHWPDELDRCTVIGGKHVCRRCLVLYPVSFAVLALSLIGIHWPGRLDTLALFALPLPVVVDFIGEQVGIFRYSAKRQVATTALAALALGRSFDRYLHHNGDGAFWAMALIYGGLCAFTVLCRHIRDDRISQAHQRRMWERDPLATGFSSKEDFEAYLNASSALSRSEANVRVTAEPPVPARSRRAAERDQERHDAGNSPVSSNSTN